MLAPEMLLGLYVTQAIRWRDHSKAFEKSGYANIDGVEWTKTHICFAEMGGFVMKISKRSLNPGYRLFQTTTENVDVTTHDLSLYAANGQIEETASRQEATYLTLNCRQILALRKTGIAKRLPNISTEEIEDRSKADDFLRLITVLQILWICVQTIARWVGDLEVTQLEISTFAFAICAMFMYLRCWDKPKGVDTPITVFYYCGDAQRIHDRLGRAEEEVTQSVSGADMKSSIGMSFVFDKDTSITSTGMIIGGVKLSPSEEFAGTMAVILSGVVFGGIHLIAWNFTFPTHVEMVLWRVSALFCTCFIPASFLVSLFRQTMFEWSESSLRGRIFSAFGISLLNLAGVAYVLARLFIIVEMFRTLAFQPIEVYMGTWTVNIPYVS